jgi:hypothetical protein
MNDRQRSMPNIPQGIDAADVSVRGSASGFGQAGNKSRIGAQGRAVSRTIPVTVRERRLAWTCPSCWLMCTL